jgi:hypothetical protein
MTSRLRSPWHTAAISCDMRFTLESISNFHSSWYPVYSFLRHTFSASRGLSFWSPVSTFRDIQFILHYPLHPLRISPSVQSIWHPEFTSYYIEFTLLLTSNFHSPRHPVYSCHYMQFPLSLTSLFHSTRYFIPRDSHFSLHMKNSFCFTWHLAPLPVTPSVNSTCHRNLIPHNIKFIRLITSISNSSVFLHFYFWHENLQDAVS